ncbi:MAG: hypothetical protein O2955_08985 [Planctomycetota bacterium]|nr:hypothetical protein [Planctomycetota bacterium]MDA1212641.1 hypothetical protein [Planctomycetota bacterium]
MFAQDAAEPTNNRESDASTDKQQTVPASSESSPGADEPVIKTKAPVVPLPYDLTPYRVHLGVSFPIGGTISRAVQQQVHSSLSHAVMRSVSGMWDHTVEENDWMFPANAEGVRRLTPDELKIRYRRGDWDKAFFIAIAPLGAGFQLAAREWDVVTESLGPVSETIVYDERELGNAAFRLSISLFRAVAYVTSADSQRAELVLRAGEYPPPDDDCQQLHVGEYLTPELLIYTRERDIKGIQQVPWTYLTVESIERGRVVCEVKSGLRAALPGKKRRIETVALVSKPHLESSKIHLTLSKNDRRNLVGYHVTLTSVHPREIAAWERALEKAREENPDATPDSPPPGELQFFLSDREGNVGIPHTPEHPLIWLTVRSGKLLLARVPYIPGVVPVTDLELPDDTIRLMAEGDLSILQGRLIDTVAQGAVLRAKAIAALKDGKPEEAAVSKQKWEALDKRDNFLADLSSIRVTGVEAARADKDKLTEARVRAICKETEELINRYLDPKKVSDFESEYAEFKSLKTE